MSHSRYRRFPRVVGYGGRTSELRPRGATARASPRLPLRPPEPVPPRCRVSGALRRGLRDCHPHRWRVLSPPRPRALAGAPSARRVTV